MVRGSYTLDPGPATMLTALLVAASLQGGGFDIPGGYHWDGMGRTAFFLDDLTGDGVAEIGTSAFCADSNGVNSGAVYVCDGRTGARLRRHVGPGCKVRLGEAGATVGDLDLDGYLDYAAGARFAAFAGPASGSVWVWSGFSGATLLRIDGRAAGEQFGHALCGPGDIDGDGVPDLLVGLPAARSGQGEARIHSGADGRLLRAHTGIYTAGALGAAVAPCGDVDADGRPDYAVGLPGAMHDLGLVRIYSGAGGTLAEWTGDVGGGRFGAVLAAAGDCDGDGFSELLVGQPGAGAIQLWSPRLDQMLRRHALPPSLAGRGLGTAAAGAGDVDGDGFADYLLGLPGEWRGFHFLAPGGPVLVVSGATGLLLGRIQPTGPDDAFGHALAGGVDLNGDGRPDFLIGAPAWGDLLVNAPGALCVRYSR
ncbi:MAG: hypothetical protein D6702_01255 [Planctomycetota bacterium]|nr:MAG: hypothetical protein D6702_01255 [Planctomycetota bacterium]